jgi:tetratricopeptide (TPR) repeat protein
MNFNYGIYAALTGAAIVLVQPQVAVALTANQVNRIASEITVVVDGINPGSGVIVAKNGNTYYVLTAKHVVETEDEYAIGTPDGRRYPLNYRTVRKLPGVDLALLQFTSDQNYRVATLANYDYDAKFKYIFVSGWQESKLAIANRRRLFNAGLLISNDYKLAFIKNAVSDGYDLFYTNITEVGMSGAPVLDMQGQVIGIHGQSEGEKIYDAMSREIYRVKLGFSSGVPASAFLKAVQQSGIKLSLKVENSPPSELTRQENRSIEAFLQAPTAAGSSNAVDWANRGNELYRLERFEEALLAFDRAIKINSDFYPAWYGRGNVLSSMERYREAIAAYDRATEIKPDFYLVWRDRGALLAFLQRDKEALASFDKAIQFNPDDYVAWYIRGDLLANLQRYEDAIASYDKAIKIKSDFASAWTARGEALYDLKRYQDAIASLDKAIQLDPKQEDAWILKGILWLELERYSEALLAYDKSIAIAPENYQLWMLRAAALLGLKRDSEARKSAQQALKLKPNDGEILNFINALDPRSSNSVSANSILNQRRFERLNPPKPAPGWLW